MARKGEDGPVRSIEQPRCSGCYHRRVYHFLYLSERAGGERPMPCSLNNCGCRSYQPSNVRVLSG